MDFGSYSRVQALQQRIPACMADPIDPTAPRPRAALARSLAAGRQAS